MSDGSDGAIAMISAGNEEINSLSFNVSDGDSNKKNNVPYEVCTTHSAFYRQFPTLYCYEEGWKGC
jgi:hypothetical protein